MSEIKLKPCPVCGKIPKVKRNYAYEASGYGAWCTIQCKPLFRKPHLKIEEGKSMWNRAYKHAIEDWNEMNEKAELRCGESGVFVTKEQMKQIRKKFWSSSDDVLGNDMIEIDEAYRIVSECIGYEEE